MVCNGIWVSFDIFKRVWSFLYPWKTFYEKKCVENLASLLRHLVLISRESVNDYIPYAYFITQPPQYSVINCEISCIGTKPSMLTTQNVWGKWGGGGVGCERCVFKKKKKKEKGKGGNTSGKFGQKWTNFYLQWYFFLFFSQWLIFNALSFY